LFDILIYKRKTNFMTLGIGRVGWRNYVSPTPIYPTSLKLFIDAGNTASYTGTGTTVTDLVGTQNGTLINGTSYSSSDGGSFVFDGVNDYITFGTNAAIKPTTQGTITIMAKVINTTNTSNGVLFANNTFGLRKGVQIFAANKVYENGNMVHYIGSDSTQNGQYFSATGADYVDSWKMFTLTWNGTNIKTYRNGVLFNNRVQTLVVTQELSASTVLGNYPGGSYPALKGNISYLKIYDVARSQAEITADFNEIKARYESPYPSSLKLFIDAGNPLSYTGTGTTVTDLTGTQNGTLTNGVGYSSLDGGSFVFDGVNDLITFAHNAAIKPTAKGTLSVMCKLLAPYTGIVLSTMDRNTYFKGVAIYQDNSPFRVQLASNTARQSTNYSARYDGVWKMLTVTWDGTTVTKYVNDALQGTVAQTIAVTTHTNPVTIGDMSPNDYPMKGNVSWAKIYDDVITLADVQANFNSIKTRYGL
jgi:hypothetical protein